MDIDSPERHNQDLEKQYSYRFPLTLYRRYQNIVDSKSGTTYESSLYGPISALLGRIFPLKRRWMVKPQPRLRNAVELTPGHRPVGSQDSLGVIVGRAKDDVIPDFTVCAFTEDLHPDRLAMIVEGKRLKEGGVIAVAGSDKYAEWAARTARSLSGLDPDDPTASPDNAPFGPDNTIYVLSMANMSCIVSELHVDNATYSNRGYLPKLGKLLEAPVELLSLEVLTMSRCSLLRFAYERGKRYDDDFVEFLV
ncbi:hypothetical protein FISHEDRAFT_75002 [Fistulina hepatica ATCC 64428]|uniref:Uncharacterized protein n=1 Tax=Fistulina hepatica ATCC 64428 TaxID=1128425 RepID=A0A0D7AAX1_9AGAR|nr:hypothetical protein FISHEDRAFT_75002 [Fistulina hepatica ATCC 64428]